jgi:hypothetical protein
MTTNKHVAILIISYKDKNLPEFVSNLKSITKVHHSIEVFDQHPINHSKEFSEIEECSYDHQKWDDIAGPTIKRTEKIHNRMHNATHICVMTPDAALKPGWDEKLVEIVDNANIIISGNGEVSVSHGDLFSLKAEYKISDKINKTQFVDKNFIFARAEAFQEIRMPDFLKYAGEDEYWTISFMSQGYDIYSASQDIYVDTKYRSVENTYHTFSSEHNYNTVVDLLHKNNIREYKIIEKAVDEFFSFHGLSPDKINKLPYQTNDVNYNPYNLQMHEVDARRFIAGTKAVY